jgi:hypothetical protein
MSGKAFGKTCPRFERGSLSARLHIASGNRSLVQAPQTKFSDSGENFCQMQRQWKVLKFVQIVKAGVERPDSKIAGRVEVRTLKMRSYAICKLKNEFALLGLPYLSVPIH